MESQEGKNSNLSDASSAKYDIQVLDLHYEQAVRKTAYFFRFRNNLGEIGFYRETKDFWVFSIGYWSSHLNWIISESPGIFPLHLLDTGFPSVEDFFRMA